MKKGLNGWTLPRNMPLAEAASAVRTAGFDTFEPGLESEGELSVTTDEPSVRAIGEQIRATGLQISSLALGLTNLTPYTSPDPAVRQQAMDITLAGLDRANWIGAKVLLVVPGRIIDRTDPHRPIVGYSDALSYAYDALSELTFEAEARGVTIGIENTWGQFLLSPVEMRDFVDRINSPWLGVYFDTGNVLKYGFPQDWIDTLAGRICGIHIKDFKLDVGTKQGFCALGDGDVDWPEVIAALKHNGYSGPLTCEGPGDLTEISQRVDKILVYN